MTKKMLQDDLLWRNISELPYFRGFLRAVEGRFYENIELGDRILDLGCGDGHFTSRTFANTDNQFHGVDPEFRALSQASQNTVYKNLVCCVGNFLPYENAQFDTIISNSVMEHIQDIDDVVFEAHRVLKPSGKMIITVSNNNFTNNLSIARFLESIGLNILANGYRKLFNWISRHYHPDTLGEWLNKLERNGFIITNHWNYFSEKSLGILEWGHYFGLPSLMNYILFHKWVLFPSMKNPLLKRIYFWLKPHYEKDQKSENGAYSFIIAVKK